MSNYQSAIERIKKANTLQDLFRVGEGLERVHKIGHLTDNEFRRLDIMICDKINADFVEVRQ
jgi:hypothetical protein